MTFLQILKTDIYLLRKTLFDKAISMSVWSATTMIVSTYIYQAFGMSGDFGVFQMGSIIVSVIGFEIYNQSFLFLADVEGNRHITYQMTLPISGFMLMLEHVAAFVVNGFLLAMFSLPVSLIIVGNKFCWSEINYFKFFLALFFVNVFFGYFALFFMGFIKSAAKVEDWFMRILFPLWMLGGFQFSWQKLHAISPTFAYFMLLNPELYANEAIRASILGNEGYIPYWTNIFALILFTVIFGYISYYKLKKRLDLV